MKMLYNQTKPMHFTILTQERSLFFHECKKKWQTFSSLFAEKKRPEELGY